MTTSGTHLLMLIDSSDVHIWHIDLDVQRHPIDCTHSVLSVDEVQRAERFHFEPDRRRFIIAHSAVRQIIGGYVNIAPQKICFSYGPNGKPELSPLSGDRIKFNLSHSGDLALLAVAQNFSVGIDVEFINREFAGEKIAERFFSANEVATLRSVALEERVAAFFSCWTRKEAYIKASGGGLSIRLDSFDVAFAPSVPPALLRVEPPSEASRWSLYDVAVPQEYKAALVAEGKDHRLLEFRIT